MEDALLRIQMLGGFRISSGESAVEETSRKAPKFWKTLQYLVSFRHRPVSAEELIAAVWTEDEQGDPKNSMHNMMFRIRTFLVDSGIPSGKDMFLYGGSGYMWNENLDCAVDCEEFEKLYNQSCGEGIPKQERLELLLRAIDIYKGDYLPNAGAEAWVIPIVRYYKSLYIKCVHTALALLMEQGMYQQAETVCGNALLIDRSDERVHEYHLRAIMRQGKRGEAIAEYSKIAAWFNDDLGVPPPESVRALYMDILGLSDSENRRLEELSREWLEPADITGAFYCEYGVFRIIYQIEARSVVRSGKPVFVFSLTIAQNADKRDETKAMMIWLREVIQTSFRKEDIFTRATPNQFLLMLKGLSYDKCEMLSKRLTRKYEKMHGAYPLEIEIRPVTPSSW